MTEFDRLMREADLDKLRAKVVEKAKTVRATWFDTGCGPEAQEVHEQSIYALMDAVDELLRMEEKR